MSTSRLLVRDRLRRSARSSDAAKRLEAEPLPEHFDPGLANIARAQAVLAVGGATVGAISVLLPHPAELNEVGMLAVQSSSILLGAWLWVRAGHIKRWVLELMPIVGTLSVTGVVYFSGDSTSAYALYYLWVAVYAFYLLSRRDAAMQIGFAIANYLAVVLLVGGPDGESENSEVAHFAILTGTFLATAIPLFYLRGKVDKMWLRLSDAARTDFLTGLANARAFGEALAAEIERGRRADSFVSVLILDLDHFRAVNEQFGRQGGDDALREVAGLLRDDLRAMETVARTGPSQFSIVLPESDEHAGYMVAERLLASIRRAGAEGEPNLTASAGLATWPTQAETPEELVKMAERAVGAAKELGRDRVVVSSPEVVQILRGDKPHLNVPAHLNSVVSVAETLEMRDPGASDRAARVGACAARVAEQVGIDRHMTERIRLAAVLHDIGKIAVPDAVLAKPEPLDDAEWDQVRRAPVVASRILSARELADVREWVLASRERFDGSGYPRGLAGAEIPVEARIIAVAAAYVAMLEPRPYRRAFSEDGAIAELRAGGGSQFDPSIVEAFVTAAAGSSDCAALD